MPTTPRARPPAWYQDPRDPAKLRYWNGKAWAVAARSRPMWTVATAELALDGSHDPPRGDRVELDTGSLGWLTVDGSLPRVFVPRSARGAFGDPLAARARRLPSAAPPSSSGAGGRVGPAPSRSPGRATSRPVRGSARRLTVLMCVAALAALVVAATVGVSQPALWAGADAMFAVRATAACRAGLAPEPAATSSPAAAGSATASVATLRREATAATRDAAGVRSVANQLAALPVPSGAERPVQSWLAQWRDAADARQQEAAALGAEAAAATRGDAGATRDAARQAAAAASRAGQAEATADRFARSNSLAACTIGA